MVCVRFIFNIFISSFGDFWLCWAGFTSNVVEGRLEERDLPWDSVATPASCKRDMVTWRLNVQWKVLINTKLMYLCKLHWFKIFMSISCCINLNTIDTSHQYLISMFNEHYSTYQLIIWLLIELSNKDLVLIKTDKKIYIYILNS